MARGSDFYDHVLFIEHLLGNYKSLLDKKLLSDLTTQLNEIKEKQQDKLLNISVIGDFSTGKSTFINALLKHSLLETENMQSTTTASTIIEHANFFGLEIHYKNQSKYLKETPKKGIFSNLFSFFTSSNKNEKIKKFNTLDELKNEIKKFGASLDKSRDIERINVYLPAPSLNGVFRIIDTPGLNATDLWLEDITKNAIEKLSDASVIIVDANKILPTSFCEFIKNNLSNVLFQSVFIVSKIDQIRREKERARVLEAIKNKVELEFNVSNPLILPYVSTDVLMNCGEEEGEANQDFLQTSLANEKILLDYVRKKKIEVQTNKLVLMIHRLYEAVTLHVRNIQTNFQTELDLLKRTKQNDLGKFISDEKKFRVKDYTSAFYNNFIEYKQVCYESSDECVDAFLETIDEVQCENVEQLKYWCENSFEQIAINLKNWMYENHVLNQEVFNEFAINEIKLFQEDFEKYFQDYDLLRINFKINDFNSNINQSQIGHSFETQRQILKQSVDEQSASVGVGSFGGAAIAGFVGALLLGPLGWLFGGVMGGQFGSFLGSLFGPSIEEVKAKIKDSLVPNLNTMFRQTANELIDYYQRNLDIRCDFIEKEIDKYYQFYQAEVNRRISEQENLKIEIESQIRTITLDLNDIEKHKTQILALNYSETN